MTTELTQEQISKGVELLEAGEVVMFADFAHETVPAINVEMLIKSVLKYESANRRERSVALWCELTKDYQPTKWKAQVQAHVVAHTIKVIWYVGITLGAVGGVIYLFRSC